MPKNTKDLLADKRFTGRSPQRRPNTLPLRDCWLIDSEALEFFLSGEAIHVWCTIDKDRKIVVSTETKAEAEKALKEGKGVLVIPVADTIGGM